MARKYSFKCTGKIRRVSKKYIRVSLFSDEGEVVGELPRRYFPGGGLEVGQIFEYHATAYVKMVPVRAISPSQIERIRAGIEIKLPNDAF